MSDQYRAFVDRALEYIGCHYIWGGKGLLQYTPTGLKPHRFTELDDSMKPLLVFDCSGLVTHCLNIITYGAVDLRATHSAKTMLDTFPELDSDNGDGSLILYPGHVAIGLGRNRVVDAHGGDQTTTSIVEAQRRGARVEAHRRNRRDSSILGYRKIPLDRSELRSV